MAKRAGGKRAYAPRTAAAWLSLCSWAVGACILPPEGLPPPTTQNTPPEIVWDRACPRAVNTRLSTPCRFTPSVLIRDPDGGTLRTRWVIDNHDPISARYLIDLDLALTENPNLCPGSFCREAKYPSFDADDFTAAPDRPHALTLFVTDGRFLEESPTTGPDFGQIIEGEGSVAEVRWSFYLVDTPGECPCR